MILQTKLERMIDQQGLFDILSVLAVICDERAETSRRMTPTRPRTTPSTPTPWTAPSSKCGGGFSLPFFITRLQVVYLYGGDDSSPHI